MRVMVVQKEPPAIERYWVYHNITTFIASVVFAYALLQTSFARDFIIWLGNFGYISAGLIGIFFVSSFTVVPATAALVLIGENLNTLLVAFFAGIGAMIGDYFIFRFIREGLADDLGRLFAGLSEKKIFRLFHSRYFGFITPLLGAFIIASPLPDEFGVGLMGLSGMGNKKFLLISFMLNVVGIAVLLGVIDYFR